MLILIMKILTKKIVMILMKKILMKKYDKKKTEFISLFLEKTSFCFPGFKSSPLKNVRTIFSEWVFFYFLSSESYLLKLFKLGARNFHIPKYKNFLRKKEIF